MVASAPCFLTSAQARAIDTAIFVDVDGVLNIGAQDLEGSPLLLNKTNVNIATQDWGDRDMSQHMPAIERLKACIAQPLGHGDACTYAKFVCSSTWSISDELVKRLASIIRTAGDRDRVAVVLSSNWRRTQHAGKVRKLEDHIAKHLGEPFVFDARTPQRNEHNAADRLEVVGDFLAELTSQRVGLNDPLQVLVLDDFFITDFDGMFCGGMCLESAEDAEHYLSTRAAAFSPMRPRVVHCYDTWTTPSGLEMRVGGGLTMQRVDEAMAFLLDLDEDEDSTSDFSDQENQVVQFSLAVSKAPSEPNMIGLLKSKMLLSKSCGAVDELRRAYSKDALSWIQSA